MRRIPLLVLPARRRGPSRRAAADVPAVAMLDRESRGQPPREGLDLAPDRDEIGAGGAEQVDALEARLHRTLGDLVRP